MNIYNGRLLIYCMPTRSEDTLIESYSENNKKLIVTNTSLCIYIQYNKIIKNFNFELNIIQTFY